MAAMAAALLLCAAGAGLGSAAAAAGTADAAGTCGGAAECAGRAEAGGELSSLLQSRAPRAASKAKGITEIQRDYIVVNGRGYSRYAAHSALLGRYGSVFGGTAYIPPRISFTENAQDYWFEGNVEIGTSVWIESSQQMDFGVDIASNAIPATDIDLDANVNRSHHADFYLQEMRFGSMIDLTLAMNEAKFERKREYLAEKMDRPRIVTSVWILIEGDAEHINFCAGGKLKLQVKDGKLVVSGSGCRMSTWRFDADSVMAYESAMIKFDKMGMVDKLVIDRAGR